MSEFTEGYYTVYCDISKRYYAALYNMNTKKFEIIGEEVAHEPLITMATKCNIISVKKNK